MISKSKKKQTKTKKQWKKNINVDFEQKQNIKKMENNIIDKKILDTNIEDLFVTDCNEPDILPGFLNKKHENTSAKHNKQLNKIIKRKINNINFNKAKSFKDNSIGDTEQKQTPFEKKAEIKGSLTFSDINLVEELWGNTTSNCKKNNKLISLTNICSNINNDYPKVPIPHPGLSYNPNKSDIKDLYKNIVNNNKFILQEKKIVHDLDIKNLKNQTSNNDKKQEFEDNNETSEENLQNKVNTEYSTIKNTKSKPLTKYQRNKKVKAKLNKVKNRQQKVLKENKNYIANVLSNKNFDKIKKENETKLEKEKILIKQQEENTKKLLSLGATFIKE